MVLALAPLSMLLMATQPAVGQHHRPGITEDREEGRKGAWGMLGLGIGGQGFRLTGDEGFHDVLYKPTVAFRLGGTVGSHLRLGIETSAWINSTFEGEEALAAGMVIGQIYPARKAGLFLKAGAGIGYYGISTFDEFGEYSEGDIGFATSLGIGTEFRLAQKVFLVPTVDYTWHFFDFRDFASYRTRVVSFGVAVLFQE